MPCKRVCRFIATAAAAVAFCAPAGASAQAVDVIRGRVVGEDSVAIAGARVQAVSLSGNVTRRALTDNSGRFTITFPNGDGDYMVTVQAIGFSMKRFQVKRTADQEILIADAKLSRAMTELEAVRVTPGERTRAVRDDRQPDISGTERNVAAANVSAGDAGNIAAMAASLPGVTLVPGTAGDPSGFSVLGLTPDQEEGRLHALRGEDVEDLVGVFRQRAVVEGQHHLARGEEALLLGVPGDVAVEGTGGRIDFDDTRDAEPSGAAVRGLSRGAGRCEGRAGDCCGDPCEGQDRGAAHGTNPLKLRTFAHHR